MTIINETTNTITVKGEKRNLTFWILGTGLIPLHFKPSLVEDNEVRYAIKKHLKLK